MSDTISRQAVKELAHKQVREKYCGMALKEQRDFYIKLADSIIDSLPPIQPKRGKWVLVCDNNGMHFICDKCGAWRYHQEQNFCGECGADMREVTT